MTEQNETSNNSGNQSETKTSNEQPQSSGQESPEQSSPFQDGLMAGHLDPRQPLKDSLLGKLNRSSAPAPKTKTVRAKARRYPR